MPAAPRKKNAAMWSFAAFVFGITAAKSAFNDLTVWLIAAMTLAVAAFALRKTRAFGLMFLAAFSAAGGAAFSYEFRSVTPDRIRYIYDTGRIESGEPVEIEGVLSAGPEPRFDGIEFPVRVEKLAYKSEEMPASGVVRLFLRTEPLPGEEPPEQLERPLIYGSRIRVAVRLIRDDGYLNPGITPRREILDSQGIDAVGSVKSALLIEHLADESVFLPLAWGYAARTAMIDEYRRSLGPEAAGIMSAMTLGDKYLLDKRTAEVFREGGTFHILVISGLHITFIGGLLMLIVRRLSRNRWFHFAVVSSGLWIYTIAVGADPPVVRAALMFTVVLFGYAIYRSGSMLNILGFCALLIAAWRPSDIFNASFQLTFISVAAIAGIGWPLVIMCREIGGWMPTAKQPFPPNVPLPVARFCEALYWNPAAWQIAQSSQNWKAKILKPEKAGLFGSELLQKLSRYAFEAAVISVSVQAAMLPLMIIYFNRVSVAGVVLNLWVAPLAAASGVTAFAGAAVAQLSDTLALPFFLLTEFGTLLMLAMPRFVTENSWASFRLPAFHGVGVLFYAAYFAAIIGIAWFVGKLRPFDLTKAGTGKYLLAASLAAAVFGVVSIIGPMPTHDGTLRVDFIDVGQGDATLVTFPDGSTLLVDGGGQLDFRSMRRQEDEAAEFVPDRLGIGEAVVSKVLWHRGLRRIDAVAATHADADHTQGLTDVLKNFAAGALWIGPGTADEPEIASLAALAARRGVPAVIMHRGMRFAAAGANIEVLHPAADAAARNNDNSLVLRLTFGGRSFLLTGDIERGGESALTANGLPAADVVKVPHHGSRTSSTRGFVTAAGARYAVVSAGRRSRFGHPHPEVVETWLAAGAEIFSTQDRGLITFRTDGREVWVETFR
jgi:competence protein ComEC